MSPTGKSVILAEGLGTWGDDFSGTTFTDNATASIVSALPPFAGRYRPVEQLAALNGSARGGTWTLKVTDMRARYAGRLDGWRLQMSTCAGTQQRTYAGAPAPPPLPTAMPTGREPDEGQLVTVTATTDGSNGDVSSVRALQANPGPDGLSLREAIEATNNDPGTYTVRFDSALDGATIAVNNEPPVLRGGHVFINGDVDGDGRPDVTLADDTQQLGWAFNVASTGNRLHALALRGFGKGVVFTAMRNDRFGGPLLKNQTLARNVVSGLELRGVVTPITVQPTFGHRDCDQSPCRTSNRWLDTRIVGNTIDSHHNGGIGVGWASDDGDVMRRVSVVGNRIQLGRKSAQGLEGVGLNLAVGIGGAGASDDVISEALVAYNAIDLPRGKALQVLAGQVGRSGNAVVDVRIVGNHVSFPHSNSASEAVSIFVSDDCFPSGHSDCHNRVRRIDVLSNVLKGAYVGVRVAEPCCNVQSSTVAHVRIAANVIRTIIAAPTEFEVPWGVAIGGTSPGVSDVSVESNTIVQTRITDRNYGAFLTAGGIAVLGGLGKSGTSIRGVSVAYNRVATKLIGILLLGGGPSHENRGQGDATNDRVTHVKLRGNVVTRAPRLARHWDSRIKGISVIGGVAGAARPHSGWSAYDNAVECVPARGNIVAGKRNDIAVVSNVGAGALRNTARFGGC